MSMEDIFTTEEFHYNDDGKRVKVTRKIQRVIKVERVHKSVAERKKLAKFGDSVRDKPGPNESTTVLGEEVFLRLSRGSKAPAEEETMAETLSKVKNKVIICRYCKGEHWSTKCPFKNHALLLSGKEDVMGTSGRGDAGSEAGIGASGSAAPPGKYIPPQKKLALLSGTEVPASRRFEDSTVRVTNLPEETIEDDLREIFRRFGSIVRIYLSRDRKTGFCKGFAFVSFETKEEAERALRVNGHGYQNLIMRVEMSEPSSSSST